MARSRAGSLLLLAGPALAACASEPHHPSATNLAPNTPVTRSCNANDWTASPLPSLRVGHARPDEGQTALLRASFSPGGSLVATEVGAELRLWSARDGKLLRSDLPGARFIDETHVLGAFESGMQSLDLETGARVSIPAPAFDSLLAHDARMVAVMHEGGLSFFDTISGELVDQGSTTPSRAYAVPGTEALFASTEGTGAVLWSWSSRRPILVLDERAAPPSDKVSDYAVSRDGARVCVMGWKGLRVLDVRSGATVFTQAVAPIQGSFSSGFVPATVRFCALSDDGLRVAFAAIDPEGFRGYAASEETVTVLDAKGTVIKAFAATGVEGLAFDASGSRLDVTVGAGLDGTAPDGTTRCEAHLIPSGDSAACDDPPRNAEPSTMGADGVVTLIRPDGTKLAFDAARGLDRTSFSALSATPHPFLPRAASNPSRITKAPPECGARSVLARAPGRMLVVDADDRDALYECQPSMPFPSAMRRVPLGEHRRAEVAMYAEDGSVLAIGDSVATELFSVATLERFAFIPSGGLTRVFEGAALFSEASGALVAYRWADCSTLRFAPVRDGSARGWVAAVGTDVEADAVGATFLEPSLATKPGIVRPFFAP